MSTSDKFSWHTGELEPIGPSLAFTVLLTDKQDQPLLDVTLYAHDASHAISRARELLPEEELRLVRGTVVSPVVPKPEI